jgi:type IV pilus assembly protein PilV
MRHHFTPSRRQHGTSLVEILVSMLILTMGVLAMAGLHTAAIRYSKTAEFRTTAVHLAEDLTERMRTNTTGVINNNYLRQVAWTDNLPVQVVPAITCTSACLPTLIAQQVAANDLAQWLNQARTALPGAGLYIQAAAPGAARMDVWVSWLEPAGDTANAAADAQINSAYACPAAMGGPTNLRCLRLRVTP